MIHICSSKTISSHLSCFSATEKHQTISYKIGDLGHVTPFDESRYEEGDCRYAAKEIIQSNSCIDLRMGDIFSLGKKLNYSWISTSLMFFYIQLFPRLKLRRWKFSQRTDRNGTTSDQPRFHNISGQLPVISSWAKGLQKLSRECSRKIQHSGRARSRSLLSSKWRR